MKYISFLPLVLGLLIFSILLFRKRTTTRVMQILCITLALTAAIFLLFIPEWKTSCRIIVIVAGEQLTQNENWPTQVEEALNVIARQQKIAKYQVLLVPPPNIEKVEKGGIAPVSPLFRFFHGKFSASEASICCSLEEALEVACREFSQISKRRRLYDTITGCRYRILVMNGRDGKPKPLDISHFIHKAVGLEIIVDVINMNSAAAKNELAELEILTSWEQLYTGTAIQNMGEKKITLRLKSPRLQKYHRRNLVWHFEGRINREGGDSEFILHTEQNNAKERSGKTVVSPYNTVEIEIPLQWSTPGINLIPAGFNLIDCSLELELPDGSMINASQQKYFLVREPRKLIFVHGQMGSSDIDKRFPYACEDLYRAWRGATDWSGRIPPALEIQQESFMNVSDYIRRYRNDSEIPFLLILHDIPDSIWHEQREFDEVLCKHIGEGTHVIICGLPVEEYGDHNGQTFHPQWKKMMPAFAVDREKKLCWLVDRSLRVTFVKDTSRLGRFNYHPTYEVKHNENELEKLSSAEDWQNKIVENFEKHPGIQQLIQNKKNKLCIQTFSPQFPIFPDNLDLNMAIASNLSFRVSYLFPDPTRKNLQQQMSQNYAPFLFFPENQLKFPPVNTLAVHEIAIIFSLALPQSSNFTGVVKALLARGAMVYIIPISSPYTVRADTHFEKDPQIRNIFNEKFVAHLESVATRGAISEAEYTRGMPLYPLEEDWEKRLIVYEQSIDLAEIDAYRQERIVNKIVNDLVAKVETMSNPKALIFVPQRLGRFFNDDRIEAHPTTELEQWAAPCHFQILKPVNEALFPCYCLLRDETPFPFHKSYPCAYGGIVNKSLVLGLGYSPFEFLERKDIRHQVHSPLLDNHRRERQFHDLFGIERILDVATSLQELQDIPNATPRLQQVTVDPYGKITLQIRRQFSENNIAASVEELEMVRDKPPVLREKLFLSYLNPQRSFLHYELLPSQVINLTSNQSYGIWCDVGNAKTKTKLEPENLIFLSKRPSVTFADLSLENALLMLAHYSGGKAAEISTLPNYNFSTMFPAIFTIIFAFALLWITGTIHKLKFWRKKAILIDAETAGQTPDPSLSGLISQRQGIFRQPDNLAKTGEFATYQPFEPGDRLDAAMVLDLVQMSHFHRPVIPRIIYRYRYDSFRMWIYINVGSSLRIPALRGKTPPKLFAAAQIAQIMAEIGWSKGAEVAVYTLGLAKIMPPYGPFYCGIGKDLFQYCLDCEKHRTGYGQNLTFSNIMENTKIIYISDFLQEDSSDLFQKVTRIKTDGAQFAAICVYSPSEFQLLDLGYIPSAGIVTDRSQWTSGDLELMYQRFWQQLPFHATEGGFTRISTTMTYEEMMDTICNSQIVQILH